MNFIKELPNRLRRITTSGAYRAEIDGLRFFAILPVVLWHGIQRISRAQPDLSVDEQSMMLWLPEAGVGVMLFLTISGFIISTQFIRSRALGRKMDLRAYFYRRVTRIEPPYLLMLVITYVFLTLTPYVPENAVAFWRGEQSHSASFFASVFYLHGILFNEMPRFFPGGWSLEVEVQFYIIAPLLFTLFYLAGTAGRRLVVGVVVLIIAFAISRYFESIWGAAGPHRYTLIRYFFYFWLGTLIAEIQCAGLWPKLPSWAWDSAAFVALAAYLWTGVAQHMESWAVDETNLNALRVVAFFFLFAGAMKGRIFSKLCSVPWITLVGGACYSIYLTHVQVMQIAAPIVAEMFGPSSLGIAAALGTIFILPAVIVAGLVFYALVERPFMIPNWPAKVTAWFRARLGNSAIPETRSG
jgi:peptidoglycan/LPS O-acetylase OafA/YrhL